MKTDIHLITGKTGCSPYDPLKDIRHDIPDFMEKVSAITPKFFVMENKVESLTKADWSFYADVLPEYDIFFEDIGKKLFVIGARKELRFCFIPDKFSRGTTFYLFIVEQISLFIEGQRIAGYSGDRPFKSNLLVDQNRYAFCKERGYGDSEMACKFCGAKEYCENQKQRI